MYTSESTFAGIGTVVQNCDVSALRGRTIIGYEKNDDELHFILDNYTVFNLHHEQSCCESVYIVDIAGDLHDLVGSPLLIAEDVSGTSPAYVGEGNDDDYESVTWTYYKFSTNIGSVTVCWRGTSNGYYSETVQETLHTFDRTSLSNNIFNLRKYFDSAEDLGLWFLNAF